MSSDHFEHHFHHDPFKPAFTAGHTGGLSEHIGARLSDLSGASVSAGAIPGFTELANTAGNLSPALTGHYQSLIEGQSASIKPG